jgi:sodium-dependent dicarboxylate transporter 2/3/5
MIGGFFIPIAMEKWNLHLRIALFVVNIIGMGPRNETGLARWISEYCLFLSGQSPIIIVLFGITVTKLLTKVTSNTATATILMPIATPPNAIVFGLGYITIPQMVKAGIWLNVVTIIIMVPFAYFIS